MKYLQHKNMAFFHAAQYVDEGQVYYLTVRCIDSDGSVYYPNISEEDIGSNFRYTPSYSRYYDLILTQFMDEGGYKRALYCPWPIVCDSRTTGAKRLREIVHKIPMPEYKDIRQYHTNPTWVVV